MPGQAYCSQRTPAPHAGDYRSQFHAKAQAVADALSTQPYDFGFLHVKAVDDTGHDRQLALKVTPREMSLLSVGRALCD